MISLQSDAAPSFDHPLEMLHACHGKILRQCATLQKLIPHLQAHGSDEQTQQAARNMLRYFDTSGQFHHQDEEEDLFPALRKSIKNESDATELNSLLPRLLDEHVALLDSWDELRVVLLQLSEGRDASLDESLAERFISGYTNHIEIEETKLLPLAARLLTESELEQIGRRMAARRGLHT